MVKKQVSIQWSIQRTYIENYIQCICQEETCYIIFSPKIYLRFFFFILNVWHYIIPGKKKKSVRKDSYGTSQNFEVT